jgi:O-antigen/teichoic acid export membrane protein
LNARSPVSRWFSSLATITVNAAMQAVGLLIFARTLGPSEYAVIVATTAVALVAAEFVGFGAGDLLIREVSRNPEAHHSAFGRALRLVGISVVPVALLGAIAAQFWFSINATFLVVLALVASEIIASRIVFMTEQIAIAHHETRAANANRIFATVVRFSVVCIAVLVAGITTATEWAIFAIVSTAVSAGGCLFLSVRRFGAPDLNAPFGAEFHVGVLFSLMQIVRAFQFSIDKFAVGWIGTSATVGTFGVASRIAQLGMLPATAVTRITYPIFFAKGSEGLPAALRFAWRVAPAVVGIGFVASIGVVCIAYALPYLFGPGFELAKPYVLLMAFLPVLAGLQNLAGDTLTGADFQFQRLIAGLIGLLLLLAAVVTGSMTYGVLGAVSGYMVGQVAFTVVSWFTVIKLRRRFRNPGAEALSSTTTLK